MILSQFLLVLFLFFKFFFFIYRLVFCLLYLLLAQVCPEVHNLRPQICVCFDVLHVQIFFIPLTNSRLGV